MNILTHRSIAILAALLALGAEPAAAVPLSGTFAKDNDIQFFTFTLASATDIGIATTSFANDNGFVPWLSLWDSTGQFFASGSNTDSSDSSLNITGIAAGTYYGAVYVWHNFDPGVAGFAGAGPGTNFADVYDPAQFWHNGTFDTNDNYTPAESLCSPSVTGYFVFDIGGCQNRTGNWALDITAATPTALGGVAPYPSSSVPEPAPLALALAGLAGFAPFARRRPAAGGCA